MRATLAERRRILARTATRHERETMPIECPRCLQTNLDSSLTCECGFDLRPQLSRRQFESATIAVRSPPTSLKEIRKRDFVFGIGAIWIALSIGEWIRIRPQLLSQPTFEVINDSLLVGST